MSDTEQSPIILNHMYSGEYLGDNIGHEIINLFKADDGNNYIYLCKDGKYNGEFPKYVIQVRRYGTRTLEVVNIAEVDITWDWNSVKEPREKKEKATWKEKRAEAIKLIKYGEVGIESIFKENKEQGTDTFVTFKAKVVKPKSPVYISYKGNRKNVSKEVVEGENENTTSLTSLLTTEPIVLEQKKEDKYLFDVSESLRNIVKYNPAEESDYQKLKKLAEEAFAKEAFDKWIKFKDSDKIKINNESRDINEEDIEDTPGDIYGINNLELPYSNAFKYFIYKYPILLSEFCNYLLKNEEYIKSDDKLERLCQYLNNDKNECKLTIRREWENIDIIIEVDKKWLIVIENKIFSDLNGKTKKEITQLDKYYAIINDGKDINGKQKDAEIKNFPEHYKDCEKIFILLTPNHNDINISNYKDWRKLHYSHINEFLKEYISKDRKSQHLREFKKMIEQHSVEDYNYGVMKRRFERALIKAKNSESK